MRTLLLTFGMASLVFSLAAQSPELAPDPTKSPYVKEIKKTTPAERAKKDAEEAEKKLGLNSEQKAKWEAASLERVTANTSIKEKLKSCTTPQERKEYHGQMKDNQKKYKETVTALLNPEQKAKYEQLQKERRTAQKAKMKHRHADRDRN